MTTIVKSNSHPPTYKYTLLSCFCHTNSAITCTLQEKKCHFLHITSPLLHQLYQSIPPLSNPRNRSFIIEPQPKEFNPSVLIFCTSKMLTTSVFDEEVAEDHTYLQYSFHTKFTNPLLNMRQLLIRSAQLISEHHFENARRLLTFVTSATSPLADSATHRVVHHFASALFLKINNDEKPNAGNDNEEPLVMASYLSLNQITPFVRFCHLTANQAILESLGNSRAIHILDMDIMYGLQWPPFMQAIAAMDPPPYLKITAVAENEDNFVFLRQTGDRLIKFAQSLHLAFCYRISTLKSLTSAVNTNKDETLAVNCVFFLRKLHGENENDEVLRSFLVKIKTLNPRIVTVAESEFDQTQTHFLQRFVSAVDHFASIFESLEGTVAPGNRDRVAVEQVWLGREIKETVDLRCMQRRFREWKTAMRGSGFGNVALSGFALSQAKLLLRLHYPCEGYQLQFEEEEYFLLGWQDHPLFSVSSWR